ncbi:hypothetical protein JW935_00045 [candidate division KSB1 bacterium]|nr:hypothetical protein [candidate division KSB1 bacterium]
MIQISFQLEGVAPDLNLVPSRQTAVWLENMDNNELTTLYVSEYLSYGGYNDSTICSLWSKKADWEKTPSELFDLVTAATPAVDSVKTISVNCKERNIPAGRYRYNVQVHIIENYNILAQGEFMVGKDNIANVAEISYLPKLYPGTKDILVDVQMKYFLQTSK